MERLTNKREADAQREEYERRLTNGYPRNIPEERFLRLAAYEDTWLTPEEITAMQHTLDEYHKVADPLLRAQADGRLVVLPCKVGQRVFALLDTDKHISEREVKQIGMGNKIGFIGLEPIGARGREYGVALNGFGKTVFLTREEAGKALKTKEG